MATLAARRLKADLKVNVAKAPEDKQWEKQRGIDRLQGKIFDMYTWEEVLQEDGDGGKVVVCKAKSGDDTSTEYVMKIRSKKSLRAKGFEDHFRRVQQRMLNLPEHSGVIPVSKVMEDESFYYVIMEKAEGGSFFEGLIQDFPTGVIPDSEAKRMFGEMLRAVGYVHSQGMLHRDIKPDNFVMQIRSSPNSPTGKAMSPKLVDFDHAEPDFTPKVTCKDPDLIVGTVGFNAPETLLGEFSERSDLFSVGACLYLLMTGKMPYSDDIFEGSPKGIYSRMKSTPVDWECDPWQKQTHCRDLCKSLLAFAPEERPASAEDAARSEWLSDA
eukprot:TRINITY_DN18472_c0_g1_i1.p1 TRINITY_DN18472_c0_g1~~TRINITY_DN18472_c0_g1_i1.p1  ORF type:complete len:366 (-),score=66.06 TRINITY_DN18472_c0_g1_i1:163-1143(-)